MASLFEFTTRALGDLDAIWSYIAKDSVRAANRVEAAIVATCSSLASHPLQGAQRKTFTSLPLRFKPVGRYPNFIVVYRPESAPLRIVAMVHGKQNLQPLLTGANEI